MWRSCACPEEQYPMPSHNQNIILEGIYPPLPTFFDAQEALDLATYQQHIANLAGTGIAGYVVMGTNGEAGHLTTDERIPVIKATPHAWVPLACTTGDAN